jgi:hypothetical protein
MVENLNNISFTGITKPGCIYFFSDERIRKADAGSLDFLYFIEKDRQILPALKMEIGFIDDVYDQIKFLRARKIDNNCHEFLFECVEKNSRQNGLYALYLHEIQACAEFLSGCIGHFEE